MGRTGCVVLGVRRSVIFINYFLEGFQSPAEKLLIAVPEEVA